MRKLILILFILLSCASLANSGGIISFPGGGVPSGVEACGSGSPVLLLYYPFTSLTVTDGGGCSQGDTSVEKTSEVSTPNGVGTLIDTTNNGGDGYELTPSAYDIFPQGAFTIELTVNFSVMSDEADIFFIRDGGYANYVKVSIETAGGGNDIEVNRYSNGGSDVATTFDVNLATSTEYKLVLRISDSDGPDLSINGGTSFTEGSDPLTNFAASQILFIIGTINTAKNLEGTVDNLKVYSGWKTY